MAKIMAVNAGSSSIKFQLLEMPEETVIASGVMERIGLSEGIFTIKYNGLKEETAKLADTYVKIPMAGQVESLNAAIATTLFMYEAARQRGF